MLKNMQRVILTTGIIAKIKTERAIDTWSYFDIGRILESEGAI